MELTAPACERGDVAGSSFSFNCYEDDWDYRDGVPQRTLLSGKLLDVGPTSTPAYEDSSVAVLRSLETHVNADLDEVTADYRNGTLSRYFTRIDNRDPVPTSLAVTQRSQRPEAGGASVDLLRRRLELLAKRHDDPVCPQKTPQQLLIDL